MGLGANRHLSSRGRPRGGFISLSLVDANDSTTTVIPCNDLHATVRVACDIAELNLWWTASTHCHASRRISLSAAARTWRTLSRFRPQTCTKTSSHAVCMQLTCLAIIYRIQAIGNYLNLPRTLPLQHPTRSILAALITATGVNGHVRLPPLNNLSPNLAALPSKE